MSLNEAAYAAGFEAIAYSSGLTKPTPEAVAGFAVQVGEASASASIAAQIGRGRRGAADRGPAVGEAFALNALL